jgi:ABC-2 type transport system ATP-binding protein
MLATLLRPSGGTARVAGHDLVAEPDEVRRIIGYVPEGADLYEVLSGREFLDLVRDLHRIPAGEAAERRAPLAAAFDLAGDLDRPIGEYSKGMKQKLLLIAALQHDPRVLLLDEPLDGLDVPAQELLKELIRERAARGDAIVYSSHILEVVERICDRVAILHQGTLAALGSPRELLEGAGEASLSRLFLRLTGAPPGEAAR